MDDHRHHGGSGFFNGFVLGLLVGAGLVFLFGTSKGKKVLQMLLEQVEENTELADLLEIPEGEEEEYFDAIEEEPEEVDKSPKGTSFSEAAPEEEERYVREVHTHHEEKKHSPKPVAKIKRFFRGSPKKLVS